MTREQGLQAWPSIRPTRFEASNSLPVLIQVPAVSGGPHRPRSSASWARVRPTARRRRLRREVRWTGYALLATMPLAFAILLFGGGRPSVSLASSAMPQQIATPPENESSSEATRPPSISITIEPTSPPSMVDVEAPVDFPGYLLPDDEREESAHAGS